MDIRLSPKILIAVGAMATLGWFSGRILGETYGGTFGSGNAPLNGWIGIFAGIVTGLSIGLYWDHRRRRFIAALWVTIALLVSYYQGGPLTTIFAIITILLTFAVSASIIRELYDQGEIAALVHHFHLLVTRRGGFQIIEDGKTILPSGRGPHFGPLLVIVKPGNAVILEQGPRFTRICGPSVFNSNRFEYVKHYIPLFPKARTFNQYEVLTRDLVPLRVEMSVIYGVNVSEETLRGENGKKNLPDGSQGLTQEEHDRLQHLFIEWPNWEKEFAHLVSSATRQAFSADFLDSLLNVDGYEGIADEIRHHLQATTGKWGVRVYSLNITTIQPAQQVIDASQKHLIAKTQAETLQLKEQARGAAWRLALAEVAQGYQFALEDERMTDAQIQRETARHMMEYLSQGSANKIVLSSLADPVLREMALGNVASELPDKKNESEHVATDGAQPIDGAG